MKWTIHTQTPRLVFVFEFVRPSAWTVTALNEHERVVEPTTHAFPTLDALVEGKCAELEAAHNPQAAAALRRAAEWVDNPPPPLPAPTPPGGKVVSAFDYWPNARNTYALHSYECNAQTKILEGVHHSYVLCLDDPGRYMERGTVCVGVVEVRRPWRDEESRFFAWHPQSPTDRARAMAEAAAYAAELAARHGVPNWFIEPYGNCPYTEYVARPAATTS